MKLFFDDDPDVKEAGIDEAGRGCLSGRMYAAAVILPREFPDEKYKEIKDSKKLTKKKKVRVTRLYRESCYWFFCRLFRTRRN